MCTGPILLVRVESEGELYTDGGRYGLGICRGSFRDGSAFELGGGRMSLYLPPPAAVLLEVVEDV